MTHSMLIAPIPAMARNLVALALWASLALVMQPPGSAVGQEALKFKGSLTSYFDSAVSGGRTSQVQSSGKVDAFLVFDGEKAWGWRGFSAVAELEYAFGDSINSVQTGNLFPANLPSVLPRSAGKDASLSIVLTQRFSDQISLSFGKFSVVTLADQIPVAGGNGLGNFQYTGLLAPPNFVMPSYVLGANLGISTRKVNYGLFIYSAGNAQAKDFWDHPFRKGVVVNASATYKAEIGGKPGFYTINLIHSSANGIDFDSVLLDPYAVGYTQRTRGMNYLSFGAQQYIAFDPATGRGWGVFGQIGLGDGVSHQLENAVIVGVAGSSPFPGREGDRWGVGYSYYNLSDSMVALIRKAGGNLRNEWAAEMYYEAEITPTFRLGVNVLSIHPARAAFDQATFVGVRARIVF